MKTIFFKSETRGSTDYGWLKANYYFSFAQYFNPERIQFGALRVLNDDTVAAGTGFSTHPHDNMEIITIPLSGTLKHRDSMHGSWQEIKVGEVQVMSAGSGLTHSEMNASQTEALQLFQIWILPNEKNVSPRYDQKFFDAKARENQLQTLVTSFDSPHEGCLKIHQNARISRISLSENYAFQYTLEHTQNGVFILNVDGAVHIDGIELNTRDALGVWDTNSVAIEAKTESDVLFLEVPMV